MNNLESESKKQRCHHQNKYENKLQNRHNYSNQHQKCHELPKVGRMSERECLCLSLSSLRELNDNCYELEMFKMVE